MNFYYFSFLFLVYPLSFSFHYEWIALSCFLSGNFVFRIEEMNLDAVLDDKKVMWLRGGYQESIYGRVFEVDVGQRLFSWKFCC